MMKLRSEAECIIIPFPPRPPLAGLTSRDRIEVWRWHEEARLLGYDRLVIHDREPFDPPDTDSFLSVYRAGESFSRWGVSRRGSSVLAWCSKTGADLGPFASVSEALTALLAPSPVRLPVSAVS
jgi:hypothetical protein